MWQLDGHLATLRFGPFSAVLDLSRPSRGIFGIQGDAVALESAELLAIRFPPGPSADQMNPEAFARQNELVVAYPATEDWPIEVNARWIGAAAKKHASAVTFDLIVSVHTELLDSQPQVAVASNIPCSEVLRLVEPVGSRFVPLPTAQSPQAINPDVGAGCVLIRSPRGPLSYVAMVHPADFHHDELCLETGDSTRTARIVHNLFSEPLEKGVILRARVRGALVPPADDCRMAAEIYREFAATEPPLGS